MTSSTIVYSDEPVEGEGAAADRTAPIGITECSSSPSMERGPGGEVSHDLTPNPRMMKFSTLPGHIASLTSTPTPTPMILVLR